MEAHSLRRAPAGASELDLFDHRKDPLNFDDVASEHPEKVEELATLLDAWRVWVSKRQLPSDTELTEGMSGEELERLQSLGYVQ